MNELEKLLDRLTLGQQARVGEALDAFEAGRITEGEFVDLVRDIVLVGNAAGYNLGATLARSLIEREVARPQVTPAVPAGPHLDEERIGAALATILASSEDTRMQLVRLATNEPQQAAADGQHDVIRESDVVHGYVRDLEAGHCELCTWLYRGGHVWPAEKPMHRHPGCRCGMTPVTTEGEEA